MKELNHKQLLELVEYFCNYEDFTSPSNSPYSEYCCQQIYKIVHSHGECKHPDWQDEAVKIYLALKERKEI